MNNAMMQVQATVGGVLYEAELSPSGRVEVTAGGRWAGTGGWSGARIEDCPADLPAEAYEALDAALAAEVAS